MSVVIYLFIYLCIYLLFCNVTLICLHAREAGGRWQDILKHNNLLTHVWVEVIL